MSEANYLLPCPFCGGEAEYKSELYIDPVIDEDGAYVDAESYYYEWVTCKNCGAEIQSANEDEPEGITIQKWNQRTNE